MKGFVKENLPLAHLPPIISFLQADFDAGWLGAFHTKKAFVFFGKNLYLYLAAGNPQLVQGNFNCLVGSPAFYLNTFHLYLFFAYLPRHCFKMLQQSLPAFF